MDDYKQNFSEVLADSSALFFKDGLIININAHGMISHPHFHSIKFFSDTFNFVHQFKSPYISREKDGQFIIDPIKQPYPYKSNRHLIIDEFIKKILNKKIRTSMLILKV